MNLYFVVAADLKNLRMYTDLFYNKDEALNAGWKLAVHLTLSSPEDFISNPQPTDIDGVTSWVYANGNSSYLVVEERIVSLNTSVQVGDLPDPHQEEFFSKDFSLDGLTHILKLFEEFNSVTETPFVTVTPNILNTSASDNNLFDTLDASLLDNYPPVSVPSVFSSVPVDDPLEDSLPATFSYDSKPMTVADVKADVEAAEPTYLLSEAKRFALVTARLRKRPNFIFTVQNLSGVQLNQTKALSELKLKSDIAYDIVADDCSIIDNLIDDLRNEESSSSSEEEDESSSEDS